MKKNVVLKVLAIAIIMTLAVAVMVSCTPDNTVEQKYDIPDNVEISIKIYEGKAEEANLKGTITKDTLLGVNQKIATMTTVKDEVETTSNYVAYSMSDIIKKLDIALPTITSVRAVGTDDFSRDFEITSFNKSYISIGYEDDGEFAADEKNGSSNAPRFISDVDSDSAGSVTKLIAKIIINPVA